MPPPRASAGPRAAVPESGWSKMRVGVAALLALTVMLVAHHGSAESLPLGKKHVLLLNSYDPTYSWTANIVEGARSVLDKMDDVELSIEFMDSKKTFTPEYAKLLSE
ncbi:MAG TPA: hypothetical protein VGL13_16385, partial [Polyangiaceae bacterium]